MDHLYTQSTPFFHWLESLPDFTLEATGEQPAPSTSKSSESTPPHTAFDKHHESLHTVYPHLSYTQPALLLEPTPPTTHSGPSTMEPPHPQRPTRVDSSSDPSAIDDTDQTPRAPATQRRRGNDGSVSPSKRQQQQRIPRGSVSGAASRALANPGALSPPPFPTGVEMYAISRQLSEQSLDPRDSTSQRDAISQRTGSQATSASNPTGTGTGVSSKALDDYTLHNLPFLNPPAQLSTVSSWRTARPRIFRKLPPRVRVLYELVTTAIYCEAYIPLSVQSSLRDHLRRRDEAHLIPASMAFLPDTEELDVRWPQLRDMVRDLEPTDEASLMMLIVHPLLNIATRIFKESFIGLSDFEARAEESDAHPAALDGVSESLPPLPSPRPILPNGRPLSDRSVDVLVM